MRLQGGLRGNLNTHTTMFGHNITSSLKTEYTKGLQAGRDEVIAVLLEVVQDPRRQWGNDGLEAVRELAKQLCEDFPAED